MILRAFTDGPETRFLRGLGSCRRILLRPNATSNLEIQICDIVCDVLVAHFDSIRQLTLWSQEIADSGNQFTQWHDASIRSKKTPATVIWSSLPGYQKPWFRRRSQRSRCKPVSLFLKVFVLLLRRLFNVSPFHVRVHVTPHFAKLLSKFKEWNAWILCLHSLTYSVGKQDK